MKIAIDAYYTLFQSGGIARYSRALISAMAEIVSTDDFILFYNRFREKSPVWSPNSTRFKVREIFLPRRLLNGMWDLFGG